jgi:DNA-binding transcriptional MerR regulator
MPSHQTQRRAPEKTEIPDKLYFRIGEVSRLCAVESYVLRFWETEFTQLRPNKSGTGQRLYRKRDVEVALRIKRLLHTEGYTIAGARQILQAESRRKGGQPELPMPVPSVTKPQATQEQPGVVVAGQHMVQNTVRVEKLRRELRELLGILSVPSATDVPRPRNVRRFQVPAATLFED